MLKQREVWLAVVTLTTQVGSYVCLVSSYCWSCGREGRSRRAHLIGSAFFRDTSIFAAIRLTRLFFSSTAWQEEGQKVSLCLTHISSVKKKHIRLKFLQEDVCSLMLLHFWLFVCFLHILLFKDLKIKTLTFLTSKWEEAGETQERERVG